MGRVGKRHTACVYQKLDVHRRGSFVPMSAFRSRLTSLETDLLGVFFRQEERQVFVGQTPFPRDQLDTRFSDAALSTGCSSSWSDGSRVAPAGRR